MRTEENTLERKFRFSRSGNSIFPALNWNTDEFTCNRTSKFKSFKTNKQLKKKICKMLIKE